MTKNILLVTRGRLSRSSRVFICYAPVGLKIHVTSMPPKVTGRELEYVVFDEYIEEINQ
jgi:hypothetical protein